MLNGYAAEPRNYRCRTSIIFTVLIEAVKEQQKIIENQQQTLKSQQKEMTELKTKVQKLETKDFIVKSQ